MVPTRIASFTVIFCLGPQTFPLVSVRVTSDCSAIFLKPLESSEKRQVSFAPQAIATVWIWAKERSRMQPGLTPPEVLEQGQSGPRKTERHPAESERTRYGNMVPGLKDRAGSAP